MKKISLFVCVLILAGCGAVNTNDFEKPESLVTENNLEASSKKFVRREKVKIKKFFDFQCAYCQRSLPIMKDLKSTYGPRVEIEYHHYPTKPGSALLAEASECARDQDLFMEFMDVYFADYFGKNDLQTIVSITQKLDLDQALVATCLESGIKKTVIESDLRLGRKYGLTAVPFFVVGDQVLTGSYPKSAFDKIIKHELTAD
jgi:protein-disulfide isomerase